MGKLQRERPASIWRPFSCARSCVHLPTASAFKFHGSGRRARAPNFNAMGRPFFAFPIEERPLNALAQQLFALWHLKTNWPSLWAFPHVNIMGFPSQQWLQCSGLSTTNHTIALTCFCSAVPFLSLQATPIAHSLYHNSPSRLHTRPRTAAATALTGWEGNEL